jgi:hypothetical protein
VFSGARVRYDALWSEVRSVVVKQEQSEQFRAAAELTAATLHRGNGHSGDTYAEFREDC